MHKLGKIQTCEKLLYIKKYTFWACTYSPFIEYDTYSGKFTMTLYFPELLRQKEWGNATKTKFTTKHCMFKATNLPKL